MDWLRQFCGSYFNLADEAFATGCVLALAAICLLQYVVHMYRMERSRRRTEAVLREKIGVEQELGSAQRERALTRLENQILREFVSQTDTEKAIDLLLRRYVENTRAGLAAFVRYTGGEAVVERSRGLSDASRRSLRIDRPWIERLLAGEVIVLEGESLRGCELLGSLSREDRGKVGQLYLLAAGEEDETFGVIVTTALYPAGAPLDQQTELAQRLLSSIVGNLRRTQERTEQESQLRSVSDILDLRAVADGRYGEPREMVAAFVASLQQKLGADRATLYLAGSDAGGPGRVVTRCGRDLPPQVLSRWQQHEDRLADLNHGRKHVRALGFDDLQRVHIDTLIRTALIVPLPRPQDGRPLGLICFTWQQAASLDESQQALVRWAADYLADNLLRVLNQSVIERQAREDGLTGLANRRTFDQQIERELSLSVQTTAQCSLLLIDLDRFKSINDTFGHPVGDDVLRATARVLREEVTRVRSNDRVLIARYGGEEMAMLLPGINLPGARRIGESIRAAIATEPIRSGPHELRVTASLGIATVPDHARTVPDLIAAADAALYEAKQSGRNRVCCAAETMATR